MKPILFFLIVCFSFVKATGQVQNSIWYFGDKAGLDFNKSPVSPITDGNIRTIEGCASIADKTGNLMFYTDGISVWNKTHSEMKNGNGLLGDKSSSQSALIVKKPDDDNLYYIFTTAISSGPLCYSLVNMLGDGNLGEVIQKNVILLSSSTEKITASKNIDGKNIWVIGHKAESSDFYAWLVTNSGIGNPEISTIGSLNGNVSTANIGTLKASLDGSQLALTGNSNSGGFLEIYKFDRTLGKVSDVRKLTGFGIEIPYGLEFSPNGQFVYVSGYTDFAPGNLYQVKLPFANGTVSGNAAVIGNAVKGGALQIAPNGKIYFSQKNQYLNVINSPNNLAPACDYKATDLFLGGRTAELGLPPLNLIGDESLAFTATGLCISGPTKIRLQSFTTLFDSILWDFNDIGSGSSNASNDQNPSHQFWQPGDYNVKVTVYNLGIPRTITQRITIYPEVKKRPLLIADNRLFCAKSTATIIASGAVGAEKYNWYDKNGKFLIQNDGNFVTPLIEETTSYSCSIANPGCEGSLQNIVIEMNKINLSITSTDTIIYTGETVTLTGKGADHYNWSPAIYLSASNSATVLSKPLNNVTYTLLATNNEGCTATKTISILLVDSILIPNTFTPNGDGTNDKWTIKQLANISNQLRIYNRQGTLLYNVKNYDNSWDGTYNGKNLSAGVYYYVLTFAKVTKSGYVTILR